MALLQQTPKVFKKKADKHMGDVVLKKGKGKKPKRKSLSLNSLSSVLDGLDHRNSYQEGSHEVTEAGQPFLCTVALCLLCVRRWFPLPPK